jgi:hypothetical protein
MNIEWIIGERVGLYRNPENPTHSERTIEEFASRDFHVVVTIADYDHSISWKVGSKKTLRHYQLTYGTSRELSEWERQNLNEYCLYEIKHDRRVVIWCADAKTSELVRNSIHRFFKHEGMTLGEFVDLKLASQSERADSIPPSMTRCQGCLEKRCITDLVCHVTSVADAEGILESGVLLSACKARNKSGEELALEKRNAAGDPPDYFEYVMFTFGNCTAGDNLVMERTLGRSPLRDELAVEFHPGVRFYFKYVDMVRHPRFRSDGYHLCKIRDSLELGPYLIAAIAPEPALAALSRIASPRIRNSLAFVDPTDYSDLWSWSSKAYEVAKEHMTGDRR